MKTRIIEIFWTSEDVEQKAEEMGLSLTDEQINSVIDYLEDNFDANTGLDWFVIENAISEVVK